MDEDEREKEESRENYRSSLAPEDRSIDAKPYIDPGFVNRRKAEAILGQPGMKAVDSLTKQLPELPEWMLEVRLDHIYTEVLLAFCEGIGIKTLEECLITKSGTLICSTITVAPCDDFYDVERPTSKWVPMGEFDYDVEINYTQRFVRSDTLRSKLHSGGTISLIAEVHGLRGRTMILHPIVMGFPWLRTENKQWKDSIIWYGTTFFENFIEDFDEFQKVRDIPVPSDISVMKDISEAAFKQCLAEILTDTAKPDWGGETSDHFTSHIHLTGKRITAAFLLKGPAHFTPMGLNHLGKNNDQIYRLSMEPAEVLFVQHCHDILPPVRATLRAFAVRPHHARRYCLIDGKDSLRLLQAYNMVDRAKSLTK